jgi:hypothetical protein
MPDEQPAAQVCGLPIIGSEVGVTYQVRATEGLSTVECLGMANLAVLRLAGALGGGGDDD